MKIIRAILAGTFVWALIFSVFTITGFIPAIQEPALLQWIIVAAFIIPFAWAGAAIYYKKEEVAKINGLYSGSIMLATALVLDALITVPFIEIPYNGSSYSAFFTNPLLWVLVLENIAVIYLYWRFKVKSTLQTTIKIK